MISLPQRGLGEQAFGQVVLDLDHDEPARPALRRGCIASVPAQQQALPSARWIADPEPPDLDAPG